RLARATGASAAKSRDETVAKYEYDASGRLIGVTSEAGTRGYRYDGPWVSAVTWRKGGDDSKGVKEEVLRTFEYNAQGQLVGESNGQNSRRHEIAAGSKGVSVTTTDGTGPARQEVTRYDGRLRPVESSAPDG